MDRRKFLICTAASAAQIAGANERIRGAIIGSGAAANSSPPNFKELGVEMNAVCDVYEANLQKGLKAAAAGAKAYDNYKRVLEEPSIDVVVIRTPDHWHADVVIDAVEVAGRLRRETPGT